MIILNQDNVSDDEIRMIYDYVLFLDNDILISYFYKNTIPEFDNDLHIYLLVVSETIKVFEKTEDYEKCHKLKLKKDESLLIINKFKK